jgi:gamma-glutamylcyclotransferase (GGCT)/AIG2-like uncharacterized protein YtfP
VKTPLYFAYGSNLDVEQMRARCPNAQPRFRALLEAHGLEFTHWSQRWRGGAADVIADAQRRVWGAVYEMGAGDFEALDPFESGYDRVELVVRGDDGRAHAVTSYAVRAKRSFAPHPEYLGKILRWGEHWRFPPEYLEQLRRRVAAPSDP